MPASSAALAERGATATPPSRTMPASRAKMPVSTLIRVDLPAPFSPTSAWTSPGISERETSSSAMTPAKCFVTPCTSRIGSSAIVTASVRVLDVVAGVGLVEQPILDDHLGRDRLAVEEALDRVEGQRSEARVGLHRGAEVAADDRLERVARDVDGHHLHVLARLEARVLERLDGAEGHLVVLRVHRVEVGVRAEDLLHHVLPRCARKVAALLGDQLH